MEEGGIAEMGHYRGINNMREPVAKSESAPHADSDIVGVQRRVSPEGVTADITHLHRLLAGLLLVPPTGDIDSVE